MADSLSPKQQRIAALSGNKKKIGADDLAALRKGAKPSGPKNPKVVTNRKKGM